MWHANYVYFGFRIQSNIPIVHMEWDSVTDCCCFNPWMIWGFNLDGRRSRTFCIISSIKADDLLNSHLNGQRSQILWIPFGLIFLSREIASIKDNSAKGILYIQMCKNDMANRWRRRRTFHSIHNKCNFSSRSSQHFDWIESPVILLEDLLRHRETITSPKWHSRESRGWDSFLSHRRHPSTGRFKVIAHFRISEFSRLTPAHARSFVNL